MTTQHVINWRTKPGIMQHILLISYMSPIFKTCQRTAVVQGASKSNS